MKTTSTKGPVTVANTQELHAAIVAGHAPEEITIASVDVDKIKADAHAAGVAEGTATAEAKVAGDIAKAATDAQTAERARVAGLHAIAMKGFEKEIQAAVESGATVEATAVAIAKLGRERGTVASLAADASQPILHGAASAGQNTKPWSNIASRFNGKKPAAKG